MWCEDGKEQFLCLQISHLGFNVSCSPPAVHIPRKHKTQDTTLPEQMKRPHMDAFLTAVYEYYDLCVWSQTSWRWLELKLTELGFLSNPNYRWIVYESCLPVSDVKF